MPPIERPKTKPSIKSYFTSLLAAIFLFSNPTPGKALEEIEGFSSEKYTELLNNAKPDKNGLYSTVIQIEVTKGNQDIFEGSKIGDKVDCTAELKFNNNGHVSVTITYFDKNEEEVIITQK